MDINVIYFKQRNSIGVLYYQFESEENSLNIGFNEINLNGRINNFKAIENSFKGNLLDLRFDNIIPVVENEELNFKED